MSEKKLLFMGDTRTGFNYGSVATSDALLKLIRQAWEPMPIRIIDYRSFRWHTPPDGWPQWRPPGRMIQNLKSVIISMGAKELAEKFRRRKSRELPVPCRLDMYEHAAEQMLGGRIFPYEARCLRDCDCVVINSEGHIVRGVMPDGRYRPGALYVLFMAYMARKHFGKYCAIINHTVDPGNADAEEMIRTVYPMLDYVSVREPLSIDELRRIGYQGEVRFCPDALFTLRPREHWEPSAELKRLVDFSRPFICLGDSAGMRSDASTVKWNVADVYSELIDRLREVCRQVVVVDGFARTHEGVNRAARRKKAAKLDLVNCPYTELIEVLKRSVMLVSGRWHASIMATLGGTPFLLWGADSHKTRALCHLYDYPTRLFDIATLPIHLDDVVREARRVLEAREELSRAIIERTEELRQQAPEGVAFLRRIAKENR